MACLVLHEGASHRNLLLEQATVGDSSVQSNQHLIVHDGGGIILDPGGLKLFSNVLTETVVRLGEAKLEHVFLSHQDPDVIASLNGWLMMTNARAWVSALWVRFVPHVGLDRLVLERLNGIPDEGMVLDLRGCRLLVLPAHFLHSPGNFHLFDPISKILYSGDVGSSMNHGYDAVKDFDEHLPFIEPFHRRYMASNRAARLWVAMIRQLEVETIAPQHGASYRGRAMVRRFLDWFEGLACGVDLLSNLALPVDSVR